MSTTPVQNAPSLVGRAQGEQDQAQDSYPQEGVGASWAHLRQTFPSAACLSRAVSQLPRKRAGCDPDTADAWPVGWQRACTAPQGSPAGGAERTREREPCGMPAGTPGASPHPPPALFLTPAGSPVFAKPQPLRALRAAGCCKASSSICTAGKQTKPGLPCCLRGGLFFLPFMLSPSWGRRTSTFLGSKRGVRMAALLQQLGRECWTADLPGELPFHPLPEQERRDMPASSLALPSSDL